MPLLLVNENTIATVPPIALASRRRGQSSLPDLSRAGE